MLFKLLLILLSMVGACGAPLVNSGSHRQKGKFSDFVPNTKQIKISVRDIRTLASRLPRAFSRSITSSAKSFVTSTAVLIPVGLVLNIKQLKPVDAWLLKGVTTGVEWAKVGAYFVGAEVFFANIRKKDDRLNVYLGSGLTSGLLRIKEGPVGMIQGFAIGYGFMYALDQFMVPTSSTKNAQGSGSNSKLSASLHDLKRALAVPTSVKSTNVIQRINSLLPTSTL